MTSPNESNGRQIQKELEQEYMFSTNNYETGLKIQLKSKETHTHTQSRYCESRDKVWRVGKAGCSTCERLVSTYTYRHITATCRHTTDIQYLHIKQTTCTAAGTLQVVGITAIVNTYHSYLEIGPFLIKHSNK